MAKQIANQGEVAGRAEARALPRPRNSIGGWLGAKLIWLLSFWPYIYFLRVVVLVGLMMLWMVYAAWRTSARALLLGLFDLNAPQIFMVSLTSFLLTWSLLAIGVLILINGEHRFNVKLGRSQQHDRGADIRRNWTQKTVFWCSLLAVPMIVYACIISTSALAWKALAAFGGLAAAIVVLEAVFLFYRMLLDPAQKPDSPRIFEPPRWFGLDKLVARIDRSDPFGPIRRALSRLIDLLPQGWGRGFFAFDQHGKRTPYPGHVLAFVMLVASISFYVAIGVYKRLYLGVIIPVPALVYALLLMMALCWGLSGLTFLFDRYRVPLLLPLAIWGLITAQFVASDYTYPILNDVAHTPVTPGEVVDVTGDSTMIVVAANGGGIQSAAWTAQVLAGLELQARKEFGPDFNGFGSSIRFISSVSGGSVGSMYVVNAYTPDGLPGDEASLRRIVDEAMTSSLDDVSYGLVYPDLIRGLLPNPWIKNDRGRALEAVWQRIVGASGLETWRDGVRAGWRPATVFNATIADTGERLLFSTVDFPRTETGSQTFSSVYPDRDLPITTAARLSASFPYITPAARAEIDDADSASFHVVDGGYYDNYGMATLAEWLDLALQRSSGRVTKVLVIEILGAPGGTDTRYAFDGDEACPHAVEAKYQRNNPRGWFYQTFAPLTTLLHVRDTGQGAHNEVEFALLKRTWSARNVDISSVKFQYEGPDTPLSWHLTESQKNDIRRHWQAQMAGCNQHQEWQRVKGFLSGQ